MIATEADRLETCRVDELVRDVRLRSDRFAEDYDHLPVERNGSFSGFLAVKRARGIERVDESDAFEPLSSDLLIGADTPIVRVLHSTSSTPWKFPRLVVAGSGIVGLVTVEDLLKPPSELVLGALMLELERRMIRRIVDAMKESGEHWSAYFDSDEQQRWKRAGGALGRIYYTGFANKLRALKKMVILDLSSRERGRLIGLRNALFHVRFPGEYDPDEVGRAIGSIRRALAQLDE